MGNDINYPDFLDFVKASWHAPVVAFYGANKEAVLADIDARISKLQATREGIVELMALSGTSPSGGPSGLSPTGKPAHDAFIGMSIPAAPVSRKTS